MWNAVRIFGLPGNITRLIQEKYKDYTCQFEYNERLSEPIAVESGVKQGCLFSPTLFLMLLNIMMTNAMNRKKMCSMSAIRQVRRSRLC
jgi:hypothetical protein